MYWNMQYMRFPTPRRYGHSGFSNTISNISKGAFMDEYNVNTICFIRIRVYYANLFCRIARIYKTPFQTPLIASPRGQYDHYTATTESRYYYRIKYLRTEILCNVIAYVDSLVV